jgi:hypothetical protein
MDLREIGCDGVDLILLVQDRDHWPILMNPLINPRGYIKGEEFLN